MPGDDSSEDTPDCGGPPKLHESAPLYHVLKRQDWCTPLLVHTGQHYDADMSDAFFADLGLPASDSHLGIGHGSHAG